ncbi:MAG: type II toxin-antitoxin system RelE/ParE family toxin, partial [Betaproteobacteria bacterium]
EFWVIARTVPLDYNVFMLTVAELSTFMRSAEKLLNAIERQDVINYLALHPKAGEVMQGTGGVRKMRWGRGGQGKSGGVRVIYYFHNESMPLYLLTLFSKNERSNLSQAERIELSELTRMLVLAWQRKQNEHKV